MNIKNSTPSPLNSNIPVQFQGDMTQQNCACGETTYVFVPDLNKTYWTKCRKCGKKIFQLNCRDCSGYSVTENDLEFFQADGSWKCPSCKKVNAITDDTVKQLSNFHYDEIPQDVLEYEKQKAGPLWAKILFAIIGLGIVILFLFILPR